MENIFRRKNIFIEVTRIKERKTLDEAFQKLRFQIVFTVERNNEREFLMNSKSTQY